nr:Flp family type IVb pilin [Clostridiales bacterium]
KVVREMKVKEFMTKLMVRFQSRKGQGMVEYGLIIGIIAVILVASLTVLRAPLTTLFGNIRDIITDNTPAVPAP